MPSCDIAVIGAGVIGGAIACELARRGADVMVVDARGAGLGASHAAAGMLAPYVEALDKPILGMAARSLALYDGFVALACTFIALGRL